MVALWRIDLKIWLYIYIYFSSTIRKIVTFLCYKQILTNWITHNLDLQISRQCNSLQLQGKNDRQRGTSKIMYHIRKRSGKKKKHDRWVHHHVPTTLKRLVAEGLRHVLSIYNPLLLSTANCFIKVQKFHVRLYFFPWFQFFLRGIRDMWKFS